MGRAKADPIDVFCRQVRARSEEHRKALALVQSQGLYSVAVSLLRQELDSMIRVIYLLGVEDRALRFKLISDSIEGRQWKHQNGRRITDRQMVQLASQLEGWTGSVYRFGCAFIHLSSFHDRQARDPFRALSTAKRRDLIAHLEHYHGPVGKQHPTFADIARFVPNVFQKIASNLESYLVRLRQGEDLDG